MLYNRHVFFHRSGDEDVWCKHGGLAVPKILHEGTNCHPIFSHLATGCVEKYHRMFNSQASLPGLCRYVSSLSSFIRFNQCNGNIFSNCVYFGHLQQGG